MISSRWVESFLCRNCVRLKLREEQRKSLANIFLTNKLYCLHCQTPFEAIRVFDNCGTQFIHATRVVYEKPLDKIYIMTKLLIFITATVCFDTYGVATWDETVIIFCTVKAYKRFNVRYLLCKSFIRNSIENPPGSCAFHFMILIRHLPIFHPNILIIISRYLHKSTTIKMPPNTEDD